MAAAVSARAPIKALTELGVALRFAPGSATILCLDIDSTLIVPGYPFTDSENSAWRAIEGLVINEKLVDFVVEFCEHASASGHAVKVYFATARDAPQTLKELTDLYELYCASGIPDELARAKIVTIAHLIATFNKRGVDIAAVASCHDYPVEDSSYHPETNPISLGYYYKTELQVIEAALVKGGDIDTTESKLATDFRRHSALLLRYLGGREELTQGKGFMLRNIRALVEKELKQPATLLWVDDYPVMIHHTVGQFATSMKELQRLIVLHINHSLGDKHSTYLWEDLHTQYDVRANERSWSFYSFDGDGLLEAAHEILWSAKPAFSFEFVQVPAQEPKAADISPIEIVSWRVIKHQGSEAPKVATALRDHGDSTESDGSVTQVSLG